MDKKTDVKTYTNFQWKGVFLKGSIWIFAYKFLMTGAVKPPNCLSEE